jgi:hypothetical protein
VLLACKAEELRVSHSDLARRMQLPLPQLVAPEIDALDALRFHLHLFHPYRALDAFLEYIQVRGYALQYRWGGAGDQQTNTLTISTLALTFYDLPLAFRYRTEWRLRRRRVWARATLAMRRRWPPIRSHKLRSSRRSARCAQPACTRYIRYSTVQYRQLQSNALICWSSIVHTVYHHSSFVSFQLSDRAVFEILCRLGAWFWYPGGAAL